MNHANEPWRPTKQQLAAANGKAVADLIAPGLKVLFCGINPGLYSAAVGHHFARPGNRFWPTLHRAGFTPRQLSPFEEAALLNAGYGITNLVARGTASAEELTREELVLGVGAYRTAFARANAVVGPQDDAIGETRLWVLPNPSGLNAHYQADALVKVFAKLRREVEKH